MSSVQLHLALTHVPVILSFVGLIILISAFFIKNKTLTKTSYILLLAAGVAAIPVFLTGEGTEEVVENLPGVSEGIIERHEEVAKLAMISIVVAGLASLAAFFSFRWHGVARIAKVAVLLLAFASAGLMTQTAHLGGQIRHTEIRNEVAMQNGNEGNGESSGKGTMQQEKDED